MELGKTFLSFRQIYLGPNLVGFKKQILNQAKFLHLMPFDQALSNTTKVIIWCIQNTRIYVVRQYRVCLSDGFWKLALEDIILQWIWFFCPGWGCRSSIAKTIWMMNHEIAMKLLIMRMGNGWYTLWSLFIFSKSSKSPGVLHANR